MHDLPKGKTSNGQTDHKKDRSHQEPTEPGDALAKRIPIRLGFPVGLRLDSFDNRGPGFGTGLGPIYGSNGTADPLLFLYHSFQPFPLLPGAHKIRHLHAGVGRFPILPGCTHLGRQGGEFILRLQFHSKPQPDLKWTGHGQHQQQGQGHARPKGKSRTTVAIDWSAAAHDHCATHHQDHGHPDPCILREFLQAGTHWPAPPSSTRSSNSRSRAISSLLGRLRPIAPATN